MYDLVKNTVPILFYGAVFVNVFYQVKGDKMSLERKWLVSTLMVIFGGIFLFLSTMFMIQSIQHDSTRVDPFRVFNHNLFCSIAYHRNISLDIL